MGARRAGGAPIERRPGSTMLASLAKDADSFSRSPVTAARASTVRPFTLAADIAAHVSATPRSIIALSTRCAPVACSREPATGDYGKAVASLMQ